MSPIGIIGLCWVVFILYWAISAFNVKKDVAGGSWRTGALWRISMLIAAVLVLRFSFGNSAFSSFSLVTSRGFDAVSIVGIICAILGIAFAIWARYHLGRNWSPMPAMKEHHELVTSGPYTFVRHPIYTGMILATFGTTLVGGLYWWEIFAISLIVFTLRIGKEEAYMMQLFPNAYPSYKARTKALVPFIW